MIKAIFFHSSGICNGFLISGHSAFAKRGKDIVCSAVSSAVRMCCNGICEIVKDEASIKIADGKLELKINEINEKSEILIEALKIELSLIEKEFPKQIKLKNEEI